MLHPSSHVHVLIPEGIAHRAQLAAGFIKGKRAQFEAIQAELEKLPGEFTEKPGDGAGMSRNRLSEWLIQQLSMPCVMASSQISDVEVGHDLSFANIEMMS